MNTLRFLCFAALIFQGLCCANKKNPVKLTVWQRLVGQDVTTAPYSGNGDSPVNTGDELNCDFESGGCCWNNAAPPTDQVDWVTVSGAPELKKMQSSFGTQNLPSGNALGAGTETSSADGTAQQAQLYSCPIACSDGQVTVSVKHWATKDVTIQVCQEDNPAGPPSNCQTLPPTNNGNADSVSLPGGPNARLVIIANGFTVKSGSVAMIDDISVQFTQCFSTTTTQATTTTTLPPVTTIAPATCSALKCNFEKVSTCSYTNAQSTAGGKAWAAKSGPFENPLTGINKAAEGTYMAAVFLRSGEQAVMSTNVDFPSGYILSFYGYRATEGIDLSACCGDSNNCPYSTTNQVQVSDYRSWKTATVTCPPGTTKVLFKAKNSGSNQGAAGLDNIQVLAQGSNTAVC